MPFPAAPDVKTVPKIDEQTRLTPMWRVLIHNDPVTPMDLVVAVLLEIWKLGLPDSVRIMMEAHETGVALVVVETQEQAEFHIDRAHSIARGRGFPLSFSMEPEG